jgi:hypothetical protein
MIIAGVDISERELAALLLIAGALVFTVGGFLFTGREFAHWRIGQTAEFARWERGLVAAGLLLNVLGFTALESMLSAAGTSILARLALVTMLLSAAVLLAAEMTWLHNRVWVYPQVVLYVVLAFLAQAAFGVALAQSGLVAAWVGWATVAWNLACLVVLAVASPRNMYFPALHHLAPLVIGIALLVSR